MTFAPVDHFAIGFDSSSEMIDPVKPTTAENASSGPTSMPVSAMPARSSPSSLRTIDSTTRTAMLVARKRTMRFMELASEERAGRP